MSDSSSWYLISRPEFQSGQEAHEFNFFAQSSFKELLDTSPIADVIPVTSANGELRYVQGIIQQRTENALNLPLERQMLCEIGELKVGEYIYHNDNYWLTCMLPDNNKMYEKIVCRLCQYKFKWQKPTGEIVSWWGFVEDATKYTSGERPGTVLTVMEANSKVTFPLNDDTIQLRNGDRLLVDVETQNGLKPYRPTIWEITRVNITTTNFAQGQLITFTLTEDEYDADKDSRLTEIADYHTPVEEPSTNFAITVPNRTVRIGIPKHFDTEGAPDGVDIDWSVSAEDINTAFITLTPTETGVDVLISENTLWVGKTFELTARYDAQHSHTITVLVCDII